MVGTLERLHEERTTKKTTLWKPLSSRPKGRPKKKWEGVLQDFQFMKIKSWKTLVRRKEQWKEIVELAKTNLGLQSCYRRRIEARWRYEDKTVNFLHLITRYM
jgi:hypothetical protein